MTSKNLGKASADERDAQIVEQLNQERAKIKASPSDLPVSTIASWVKNEVIDISPDFQRRNRWKPIRRSQLIESFLMKIPVPPVYLYREATGPYTVIDGKQRITAIFEFISNGLELKGLKRLTKLEGATYQTLPSALKRQLDVEPALRVIVVDSVEDEVAGNGNIPRAPLVKYEVFHRLNTGGVKLEPQEIRNAMYRGELNDLVVSLAANPFLQAQMKATPGTANYDKMKDQEFVLRFLMMRENWTNVSSHINKLMDKFMQVNQDVSPERIEELRNDFNLMITRAEQFFGDSAFRNWNPNGGWRDQQNVAVYDAQSIAIWTLTNEEFSRIMEDRENKLEEVRRLFRKDEPFAVAISGTTASKQAVETRICELLQVLRG